MRSAPDPGEAFAADADAVAHRLAVTEHEIEVGVRRIDDDGAGRLDRLCSRPPGGGTAAAIPWPGPSGCSSGGSAATTVALIRLRPGRRTQPARMIEPVTSAGTGALATSAGGRWSCATSALASAAARNRATRRDRRPHREPAGRSGHRRAPGKRRVAGNSTGRRRRVSRGRRRIILRGGAAE